MSEFSDPKQNSITGSSIEEIDSFELPFFIFYGGWALWSLDVNYIQNGNIFYNYSDIYIANASNFKYDESVNVWTLVYFGKQSLFKSIKQ